MSDIPLGRFVWYELMTKDDDAAQSFYSDVIGWGVQPWRTADNPEGLPAYTIWMVGERPMGGVMRLPDEAQAHGAPSHWIAYISTPDVGETTAKARELGANILVDNMQIPEVGTMSIIADPHGAHFAIYTPAGDTPGIDGMPGHGDMSWHELWCDDYQSGYEFYRQLFGWEITEDLDMGEAGVYRMYGLGGQTFGGMMTRTPEMPVSAWLIYTTVDDIDATVEKVQAAGGQLLHGPMEVPGGDRVAHCMDPQGAAFALHEHKKQG